MISGGTILAMMPVLMKITGDVETATTLTDAASTVSGRHTACTAPTATTADEAASAHDHNRYMYRFFLYVLAVFFYLLLYYNTGAQRLSHLLYRL